MIGKKNDEEGDGSTLEVDGFMLALGDNPRLPMVSLRRDLWGALGSRSSLRDDHPHDMVDFHSERD